MFMSDPPQPPIEHRTITQNLSTGYHPILRSNSTSVTISSTTAPVLPTKLSLAKGM